jgi:hypothetical protein
MKAGDRRDTGVANPRGCPNSRHAQAEFLAGEGEERVFDDGADLVGAAGGQTGEVA